MSTGKLILGILILVGFISCEKNESTLFPPNTQIVGRQGFPLYQLYVPMDWEIKKPQNTNYQNDTKLPLIEISQNSIKIVIHNFPGIPIPPTAQINRWKQQINSDHQTEVTSHAWGGFEGLKLSSPNVLAWAMELAYEHERSLLWDEPLSEKKAPYTIKITGKEEELFAQEEILSSIVHSFELIEPFQGDK